MKNLTLAIDDNVLDNVRKYAANRGTTVNAIVREHLTRIATQDDLAAQARRELVDLSRRSEGELGPDFKWDRAALYDRGALRGHECSDLRGDGKPASGSEEKTRE